MYFSHLTPSRIPNCGHHHSTLSAKMVVHHLALSLVRYKSPHYYMESFEWYTVDATFSLVLFLSGFLFCFTPKGFGQIMEFLKFCDSLQTNADCAIWCYSSVRPLYLAFVSSPVELSTILFCIKFLPFLLNSLESPSNRTKSIFNVVFSLSPGIWMYQHKYFANPS